MKEIAEIKIQGLLCAERAAWFEGMAISHAGSYTILAGSIKDEAHLHGILNQIRDLNLKLISVHISSK